jgi:hypothetical protein
VPDESIVPKPKGQAGRGDGYNLYDEMRISSTATYNTIRVFHFFISYMHAHLLTEFGSRMLFE